MKVDKSTLLWCVVAWMNPFIACIFKRRRPLIAAHGLQALATWTVLAIPAAIIAQFTSTLVVIGLSMAWALPNLFQASQGRDSAGKADAAVRIRGQ